MTRENKLALIVGFGLILFVGVLLSDHFSAARNSEPGSLKPLSNNGTRLNDAQREPIDLRPARPDRQTPSASTPDDPSHSPLHVQSNAPTTPGIIHLPDLQEQFADRPTIGNIAGEQTAGQTTKTHTVAAGEVLERICRRHYGDTSLLNKLAAYNKLANPDLIREGMKLRLPAAAELGGVAASSKPSEAADHNSLSTPNTATYTVKPDETLSEIAQRLMQSSRQWRQIYELNRDVISNPDLVRAGTVLRIPQN